VLAGIKIKNHFFVLVKFYIFFYFFWLYDRIILEENMKIKEMLNNFKNRLFNRIKKLPEHIDYYPKFTESIDDIGLIAMFEKQLPQNLKTIIDNSKGNIYNKPLSTQISGE
jgi:hypothetical protein